MYTPDTEQVRGVMGKFQQSHAERTGQMLNFDNGTQAFYDEMAAPSGNLGFVPVPSADFIYDYVLKNVNTTMLGVVWNITSNGTVDTYRYQVWYNASLFIGSDPSAADFWAPPLVYFERTIEEAIFNYTNPTQPIAFNVTLRPFPKLALVRVPDTVSSSLGPTFFFIITALPTVLMALNSIVGEKEKQLRRIMMMMGLRLESWMASWFLTYAIISALVALMLSAFGNAFQFEVFKNTNFGVLFFTFWLHSLAELAFSFAAAVFMRQTSTAVLFATFWYIIGLLFMSVNFSSSVIGYVWWITGTAPISPAGWKCLIFMPFFNFGVILTGIASYSTGDVNSLTQLYEPSQGFSWSDLYQPIPSSLVPLDADPPAPIQSWYWMIMNIALYLLIAWFLDSILPDEYGKRQPFWFFCKTSYWGWDSKKDRTINVKDWIQHTNTAHFTAQSKKKAVKVDNSDDSDVISLAAATENPVISTGLRVLHLRKTFRRNIAVQNSSFHVERGELLGILGSNGSGKSTTCNILTGISPTTGGDVLFDDCRSLVRGKSGLTSSIVGWCPQHDILFDELTPLEHLRLYAEIRGVNRHSIPALSEDRLNGVQLWHRRKGRVGAFSGGMRRR